jgi:hypothetical protein
MTSLILALALAMPVGLIVYSLFFDSVWDLRNLISSWPGLALLMGLIVTQGRREWAVIATALLLGGLAAGALLMVRAGQQRPDYLAAARFVDQRGQSQEPVVEAVFFTPGPFTETEAALRLVPGQRSSHPVLRLGLPPLRAVLAAPPYTTLPIPSPAAIAGQAVGLARGGRMFLVAPGDIPLNRVQAARRGPGQATSPVLAFLKALPARFALVQWRAFRTGFIPVSVYVLSDRGG